MDGAEDSAVFATQSQKQRHGHYILRYSLLYLHNTEYVNDAPEINKENCPVLYSCWTHLDSSYVEIQPGTIHEGSRPNFKPIMTILYKSGSGKNIYINSEKRLSKLRQTDLLLPAIASFKVCQGRSTKIRRLPDLLRQGSVSRHNLPKAHFLQILP